MSDQGLATSAFAGFVKSVLVLLVIAIGAVVITGFGALLVEWLVLIVI